MYTYACGQYIIVIAPTDLECYMEFIALKCGQEGNTVKAIPSAVHCICLETTLECTLHVGVMHMTGALYVSLCVFFVYTFNTCSQACTIFIPPFEN